MAEYHAERTWQAELVARYPHFFNVITEQSRAYTRGLPSVGDDWRDLVETAVGRIADAVAAAPAKSAASSAGCSSAAAGTC